MNGGESAQPALLALPERTAGPSRSTLLLAWLLLAATFFLISPPPGKTYPGAIPWRAGSLLRRVTDWMSLNGVLASVRGVEIKDFAFYLATTAGLAWLAVCAFRGRTFRGGARLGAVGSAQLLLTGWAILSLASSLWAGDAAMARGQALLYTLSVAWAVSVSATLERRHVAALLYGLLGISAAGAALCVWYYYERNPYHRPGFPIGNPLPLAAAILPAVLVAVGLLAGTVAEGWRQRRASMTWPAAAAVVALVPLVWCLWLTRTRGAALVGLGVGLATMVLSRVGRRLRWILVAALAVALLVAGAWWLSVSHLDIAMGRGATIRIRFYAWRYATELWSQSSWTQIAGQGAGAYPRLAGALAVHDRALDPEAFSGAELVEHAHNELFEVLTEIGLVGGVTYVGGFVATFFAAAVLLRRTPAGRERWLLAALAGSVAALLADALTGVDLRLPGVPAIFFTLLGALWAACRDTPRVGPAHAPSPPAARNVPRTVVLGLVSLAAAIGAGWLALQNWGGARFEQKAQAAYESGRYDVGLADILAAEWRLLDPVRVLAARQTALECRYALAQKACWAHLKQTATAPGVPDRGRAVRLAEDAYTEAVELSIAAPALMRTDKTAARSAEWLVELYRRANPQQAATWASRALQAWGRQQRRTPYDVDTLLALIGYSRSTEVRIGLLRDALRLLDTLPFEEEPQRRAYRRWLEVLVRVAQEPGFEPLVARFVSAAAPIAPETDLDAIIASMAPETYRLAAAWNGLRGENRVAADQTARAVRLYRPLHARFPNLESTALAEEADYVLRESPGNVALAVGLLQQALDALPVIQVQKYADLAAPFRRQLAFCLLVMGDVDGALDVLGLTLGDEAGNPQAVEQGLQKLLQAAAAAGSPPEQIDRVSTQLCTRFPSLCDK